MQFKFSVCTEVCVSHTSMLLKMLWRRGAVTRVTSITTIHDWLWRKRVVRVNPTRKNTVPLRYCQNMQCPFKEY